MRTCGVQRNIVGACPLCRVRLRVGEDRPQMYVTRVHVRVAEAEGSTGAEGEKGSGVRVMLVSVR
jgi:hypothetical protein